MVESTARREKPEAGNSLSYLWQVAGKPLAVSLALDLIDRLEHEVVENFRSLTSRGSEIGGLLLGHVTSTAGAPTVVSVVDYETVACDYSRGPLYRLSDADQGRFEHAIEQHLASGGAGVVGFFRGHTRKGISLDADDLAFIETRFARPNDIVLLVRPFATKASVGGIFLWEDGRMQADASSLEFPFRSAQLSESGKILETPRVAAPVPAQAAPIPPVSKPAARAQIVPIATRREFAVPSVNPAGPEPYTAPAPPSAKPEQHAKLEPPVTAPASVPVAPTESKPADIKIADAKTQTAKISPEKAPETKPAADLKTPAAEPKSADRKIKEDKPSTKIAEKKAEQAKPAPAPKPATILAAEVEPAPSRNLLPVILSVAAAVVLGVALFVYPGFLIQSRRPSVPQTASNQILRVERTGTDLLLTWNRDSEAIRNATHAVLTINDGDRQENYTMDPGQLSSGSIVYSPISADVSFRMELTERDQTKTTTESVRVLRTRPSPMADATSTPAPQKPGAASTPAGTAATPAAPGVPPPGQAASNPTDPSIPEQQPAATPIPAKKFDASSLATRLRPARESDVPVAPAMDAPAAGIPGASLSGAAPAPFAASSAPPRPVPPPAASSPASATAPGGQIREATVIYKKTPEYPVMARQMGAKGEVVLSATVGTDGRVKSVKVIKGHPLLVKAATDAVMQWIYRPTLLNGQPVQNDVRITLNFEGQ
ncbi:MAG: TonB family protein [Bryobacteraceae bacterium]